MDCATKVRAVVKDRIKVGRSYVKLPIVIPLFGVHIAFVMSRTTWYLTANVTLKMELLVQIIQIKCLLFKLLVNLLVRESVNCSL